MYVLCHINGGRYWRYDYRFAGKRLTLALGTYPDVKLADARKSHQAAREWLAKGCDPSSLKRQNRLLQHEVVHNTFGLLSTEWFEVHMSGKSEGHAIRQQRILDKDLLPSLRHRPIEEITAPELLVVLRKVEARTIDIAHRANQILKAVFNYAIDTGRLTHNPALNLSRALKRIETKHFAAITYAERVETLVARDRGIQRPRHRKNCIEVICSAISATGRNTHHAMERDKLGELRDGRGQSYQAESSPRPHITPLPAQAVAVSSERCKALRVTSEFVFPNMRKIGHRPMSDNGVRASSSRNGVW